MDQNELETYQLQLEQVEKTLSNDPDNAGLKDLAKELKELIDLTKTSIAQTSTSSKPETSRKSSSQAVNEASYSGTGKAWVAGDECLAKYSGDGAWYPARITSVGGAEDNRVYSIVFKGYNTTELVKANELKPLATSYVSNASGPYTSSSSGGAKRKLTKEEEEERERKKRKNEKKIEVRAAKATEQNEKQATWKKFTKSAVKKKIPIAGVAGTSIFKTPDNPHGKGMSIFP